MPSLLHVDLEVTPGEQNRLAHVFAARFRPAIAAQPGFRSVRLLRSAESPAHRLVIEFESEALRQRWVESAQHQTVWPEIEACCQSYSPHLFSEVEA